MSSYNILGVMSGTSMDGVDISFCSYNKAENGTWNYELHDSKTFPYNTELLTFIEKSKDLTSQELLVLDKAIGKFFAICIKLFQNEFNILNEEVFAIASHGHTVFHQPQLGYTLQIGCGDTIAFNTGIQVVNDFRQKDVIAGGQGAPLVPIGDLLLFLKEADTFLNIGGFINVCSIEPNIKAFDISPGNLPLNEIAKELKLEYDKGGDIARSGKIDSELLNKLDAIKYYNLLPPKSLGTEWLESEFASQIDISITPENRMRTIIEHISNQTANQLNQLKAKKVLITGGGAKNKFLIERIKSKTEAKLIIPSEQVIDFKEAIVFGLLGALYFEKTPNCLSSVTGANMDVVGGALHLP